MYPNFDNVKLTTRKGKNVVEYNNHLYREDNVSRVHALDANKSSSYFACCEKECKARLIIFRTMNPLDGTETIEYKSSQVAHTCTMNVAELTRKKARILVAENLRAGYRGGYRAAVKDVMMGLREQIGDDEAAQFVCASTLNRSIRREISRSLGNPPSNFAQLIQIPRDLAHTTNGERYLLVHDVFVNMDGREIGPIIVYATKSDLVELFNADLIAADGTFKIKPKPYAARRGAQVFTMNIFFGVEAASDCTAVYWHCYLQSQR